MHPETAIALAASFSIASLTFAQWRSANLKRQAEALKAAVNERTRELQIANNKLREADKLKSQLIRTVSHEYRNPLTKIMLATDLLRSRYTAPEEKRVAWLHQIEEAALRMLQLVEGLLLIESQPLYRPTQLNLDSLICQIIQEHEWVRIRYLAHTPNLTGNFDEQVVREIVSNLLSNALKYSADKVIVRLMQVGDSAIIEVRDRGIGIPSKNIPQLFADFSRGDNVGSVQGTGLGLAIAHRAAIRCGGTIVVQSWEGEGSCFRVELPM